MGEQGASDSAFVSFKLCINCVLSSSIKNEVAVSFFNWPYLGSKRHGIWGLSKVEYILFGPRRYH